MIYINQACQTQNTVRVSHGVLTAKNLSAGRSLEIYNTFCNTFLWILIKTITILPYYDCFVLEITVNLKFTVVFSHMEIKKVIVGHIKKAMGPPVWHAWYTSMI